MNTRMYPRTLQQAFPRTAHYAASIEKPAPSFWQRIVQAIKEWL